MSGALLLARGVVTVVAVASIVSWVIRRCRIRAASAGRVRRVVPGDANSACWPLAVSARVPASSLTCWEPLDRNDERLSPRIRRTNLGAGRRQAGFPAAGRNATSPPDPLLEFLENL